MTGYRYQQQQEKGYNKHPGNQAPQLGRRDLGKHYQCHEAYSEADRLANDHPHILTTGAVEEEQAEATQQHQTQQ